eukprot:gb/GECH01008964.1/.p1 GENE.gb/GECH01008964.1/~~gb/GECH01008964.1/.p1  ORF type:complete len:152 (+),score=32.14 gb/GECH01008964.1/:1-456(+)
MSCKKDSGISPRIYQQIVEQIDKIQDIFHADVVAAIIQTTGASIQFPKESKDSHTKLSDVIRDVRKVRESAKKVASTLSLRTSNALHIKGSKHMFSCYNLDTGTPHGDEYIAFYTKKTSEMMVEGFDTSQADNEMKSVLEDLSLIVRNIQT